MSEEEKPQTSVARALSLQKEKALEKLLRSIRAHSSATIRDLDRFAALSNLSIQLGEDQDASFGSKARQAVVRPAPRMITAGAFSPQLPVRVQSGGTAMKRKTSSSLTTSATTTSDSKTSSAGPTAETSEHKSKAARVASQPTPGSSRQT